MKSKSAVEALSALAQESRLAAYRALVEAGPEGLCAGDLAQKLSVPAPTLSFHLAQLRRVGLIRMTRRGRSLIYAANYPAMNALIGFLTENCCRGDAAACGVALCQPVEAKSRRKAQGAVR